MRVYDAPMRTELLALSSITTPLMHPLQAGCIISPQLCLQKSAYLLCHAHTELGLHGRPGTERMSTASRYNRTSKT